MTQAVFHTLNMLTDVNNGNAVNPSTICTYIKYVHISIISAAHVVCIVFNNLYFLWGSEYSFFEITFVCRTPLNENPL